MSRTGSDSLLRLSPTEIKMSKKKTNYEHEKDYLAFLKKRLESTNYKNNVSPEEYQKTKEKYDKVKFRLKILEGK